MKRNKIFVYIALSVYYDCCEDTFEDLFYDFLMTLYMNMLLITSYICFFYFLMTIYRNITTHILYVSKRWINPLTNIIKYQQNS